MEHLESSTTEEMMLLVRGSGIPFLESIALSIPRDGYDTTAMVTEADGVKVVIHTFPFYIQNGVTALQAKGAIPVVSSRTPDNIWGGSSIAAGLRFVGYMQTVDTGTGAVYVNHYDYVAQAYNKLGRTAVTAWYPLDRMHTAPRGSKCRRPGLRAGFTVWDEYLKEQG